MEIYLPLSTQFREDSKTGAMGAAGITKTLTQLFSNVLLRVTSWIRAMESNSLKKATPQ